jgi:membrane associated rhomboid family serine protease
MFPIQDTVPSRSTPLVTWGIILLNGLIFLRELSLPPERLEHLLATLGLIPARLGADPEAWWTVLTSMFLHGGGLHFLGNRWVLYRFGDAVEDRLGHGPYLGFYLLCGLAAALTHYFTNPTSTLPTVGASGAIAGVLGAYFLLFPTAQVVTLIPIFFFPFFVEIPAVVFLGIWFVSQLFSGTLSLLNTQYAAYESVAFWAHVGGFVAGMVLLPLFKKSRTQYRRYYADEYRPLKRSLHA